jgi:Fe-S cluster assembly ATP-binding protein
MIEEAERIGVPVELMNRSVNADASGGQKKRLEALQLALLGPKFAILDEIDSGLDVDALRDVAKRIFDEVADPRDGHDPLGVLAITHYSRIFEELRPEFVHVLVGGRIVVSGGLEIARELEADGYAKFTGSEGEHRSL